MTRAETSELLYTSDMDHALPDPTPVRLDVRLADGRDQSLKLAPIGRDFFTVTYYRHRSDWWDNPPLEVVIAGRELFALRGLASILGLDLDTSRSAQIEWTRALLRASPTARRVVLVKSHRPVATSYTRLETVDW